MIYDCFNFFNELDLLTIRLNVLDPVVDYFVITESNLTHSGVPKAFLYLENSKRYKAFQHKIIHNKITDSPNGADVSSFDRDVFEKNARLRALHNIPPDSIVMLSDLDEIPNPQEIQKIKKNIEDNKVYQFAQNQFYFYVNLKEVSGKLLSYAGEFEGVKKKKWLGTYLFRLSLLDKKNLADVRIDKSKEGSVRVADGGWHFTYMGGDSSTSVSERVEQKIKAYSHQEFNNNKVLSKLEKNITKQKDIFGRRAKFQRVEIDESFPKYIQDNQSVFSHLILPPEEKKSWWSKK